MPHRILEVCVDSTASALAAKAGGADRLELCADLAIGGTTPSAALVRQVKAETGLPVRALLRPRAGDFCDLDAMQAICTAARRAAKQAGRPVDLALHRAFDVCRDATLCLEAACELGLATVLTSGQAADAWTGRALLARLQEQAGGRIEILAGSGVNARNIPGLVRETGVTACHLSGKKRVPSRMVFRREGVPMGLPGFDEFELWQTDADAVRAARLALDIVPL